MGALPQIGVGECTITLAASAIGNAVFDATRARIGINMAIRVLIADDHTLFRRGLRRILEDDPEFQVVAEASTGIQAAEMAEQCKPDVAVLDIGMAEMNGIEA